jgi:hypothetical protein
MTQQEHVQSYFPHVCAGQDCQICLWVLRRIVFGKPVVNEEGAARV